MGGTGGQATDSSENKVAFDSRIEKIRGSLGNDTLGGCGGKNTLSGGASDPSGPGPFAEDLLMDFDGMASELPASDDVYLGSTQQGAAAVGDGGGDADVLNLGGFSSNNARIVGVDLDNDGTMGSLAVYYGSRGSFVGEMVLTNQFEDDESGSIGIPFVFDGRIEQIKFKDKIVQVTPASVEPASARQSAAIEKKFDDLSGGDLLPEGF